MTCWGHNAVSFDMLSQLANFLMTQSQLQLKMYSRKNEVYIYLGVQQADVFTPEYFCNKSTAWLQDMCHNRQGSKYELRLHKLIHIMEASNCTQTVCGVQDIPNVHPPLRPEEIEKGYYSSGASNGVSM